MSNYIQLSVPRAQRNQAANSVLINASGGAISVPNAGTYILPEREEGQEKAL